MSLEEIKRKVDLLAKKIDAPDYLLPTYETCRGDGHPCVLIDSHGYNIAYIDRGNEFERKTFLDVNDLLYFIFEDVIFLMAKNFELKNRNPNEDFRKVLFEKQMELMNKISKEYANRLKSKIDEILRISPYVD